MAEKLVGYVYLTLAMATVGSTVIASKLIAHGLPPFSATALRFAIALPLFLVLMLMTRTAWPRLDRHAWALLALQAGAGSVGYTTLLISGLGYTSAANAGVVIGTLPVVSACIAIVVLGERPQPMLVAAILVATAGVAAISFTPDASGEHSLFGDALILAAVFCEGIFILLNKRLPVQISPLAQSTLMTGIGLVLATAAATLEAPWQGAASSAALAGVVYYALVPTVGGFLLWYLGAARVTGAEASLFTAVAPVSAVLLAALVLGEAVNPNQIVGIGCVLFAVLSLGLSQAGVLRCADLVLRPTRGDQNMHFSHSEEMWRDFPELAAGVLFVEGITPGAEVSERVATFTAAADKRLGAGPESELPEIQAWRRAFQRMGLKPTQYRCASEALLRRFRKEGTLPAIHPLIDLCNAASLASAIPVAAIDVAKVDGWLEVRHATGGESYLTFSGEVEHPDPREVIFADRSGNAHARRWTNRQSGLSAVRRETATVLIVAEALHETATADVARLVDELAEAVAGAWSGSPKTALLSRSAPRFAF